MKFQKWIKHLIASSSLLNALKSHLTASTLLSLRRKWIGRTIALASLLVLSLAILPPLLMSLRSQAASQDKAGNAAPIIATSTTPLHGPLKPAMAQPTVIVATPTRVDTDKRTREPEPEPAPRWSPPNRHCPCPFFCNCRKK